MAHSPLIVWAIILMTMNFLLTTVLILSEVIIVLGALAVFLFLRLRRHGNRQEPGKTTKQEVNPNDSIRNYFQTQSDLTKNKIESIDDDTNPQEQLALASRLSLLSHETELLNHSLNTSSSDHDWEVIYKQYAGAEESPDDEDNYEEKLTTLNTRIKKLEIFRSLFTNSQDRLKKSFNIINELKTSVNDLPGEQKHEQIEDMVDHLSIENINLHKQFDVANQQLKDIFEEAALTATDISESETVQNSSMDINSSDLQAENASLTKQIQELLEQDREKTQSMQKRIVELEGQIQQEADLTANINDLKEKNELLSQQIQSLSKQAALETQEAIPTLKENIDDTSASFEGRQSVSEEPIEENSESIEEQPTSSESEESTSSDLNDTTHELEESTDLDKSDPSNAPIVTEELNVSDDITEPMEIPVQDEADATDDLIKTMDTAQPDELDELDELDESEVTTDIDETNQFDEPQEVVEPDEPKQIADPVSADITEIPDTSDKPNETEATAELDESEKPEDSRIATESVETDDPDAILASVATSKSDEEIDETIDPVKSDELDASADSDESDKPVKPDLLKPSESAIPTLGDESKITKK